MIHLKKAPTSLELKKRKKQEAYEKKQEARIKVTPENHDFIWNHLSQTLFSLDCASFNIKALQKKGAFPDSDSVVDFANKTELKFKSFLSYLEEDKREKYNKHRTEFEEFARQFSTFDEKERQRIYGMANRIEKEKYK